jgi:hypothetical protein
LLDDVDPDFVESLAIALAWNYDQLFEELSQLDALSEEYREEEFNKRRTDCAVHALASSAKKYGIPFDYVKRTCNGQHKLLVKAGRVIIFQEPISHIEARPSISEYKVKLAEVCCFVRQLELDLGDLPHRITDWSGGVLAVLLHGVTGPRFTRAHKALGSAMFGIPDASYQQWVMRADLHSIAMNGRDAFRGSATRDEPSNVTQTDEVIVTPKKKSTRRNTA